MKKMVTCVLFVFLSVVVAHSAQETTGSSTAGKEGMAPYSVKVSVNEVRNRTVEAKVRDHVVRVDQPTAFGADDTAPTPPEMLAVSLGTCVVSTIQFLAMQKKMEVKNIQVTVEGDIDFSRAMGIPTENRAGFAGLKIGVQFDSNLSSTEKGAFIKDVFERGASIDNIMNATPVTYELLR